MKINDTIEQILEQIQQPLWEHWYIKEKIGSGAYSSVYRVEAKRSERRTDVAALKIQPITANGRQFVNESDKRAYIERQKKRADAEAEIMLDLRRFQNIVFYEEEDVREFIVDGVFEGYYSLLRMELLTSIVDFIRKRRFDFSQRNIVKLACDIGKGINGAHSRGIIHRDIKLDNFFVDEYDTYKIGDFNVAKMSDTARTMAGTPGYIAPEVYTAKSDIDATYTGQADIYSFGICLYRLMNDMLFPFEDSCDTEEAHSRRYKGEKLPPPRNADRRFSEIILKACEYSTKDRYEDIRDMLVELSAINSREFDPLRAMQRKSDDPERTILAEEILPEVEAPQITVSQIFIDTNERVIEFGSYPTTASGERKPLRWKIVSIEDQNAILVTERIVDACVYSSPSDALTWDNSGIRRLLNNDFYNSAFTDEEKGHILDSQLMNYKNAAFKTNSGGKTTDRVFLLSVEEAQRFFPNDEERAVIPTAYAMSKGLFTEDGRAWWWLRTSGSSENYAADVDYGGDVDSYGSDRRSSVEGLRPAIRVSLSFLRQDDLNALSRNVVSTRSSITVYDPDDHGLEDAKVGETVLLGEYPADNGAMKTPLRWKILELSGNKALLITESCVEAKPFDSREMFLTWKQSELRRWLNDEFIATAFGSLADVLSDVKIKTPVNPVYDIGGGMDTKDKVFLLSLDEAQKYFPDNDSRKAKATPKCGGSGMFADENGFVWWWLRSMGSNRRYSANVDYGGDIDFYGSDQRAVNGVRPVVLADLTALRRP